MEKNKIKGEIEGWVARDSNGELHFLEERPHRGHSIDEWLVYRGPFLELSSERFPDVDWDDKHSRRVKITIEEI